MFHEDIPLEPLDNIKQFEENKDKKDAKYLVWYFANYCGHCHKMYGEWKKLNELKNLNPSLVILKIESSQIPELSFNPNVFGYPSIRLYKNGKEIEYYGTRTAEDMKQFLDKHLKNGSMKSKKSKKSKKTQKVKKSMKSKTSQKVKKSKKVKRNNRN